MKYMHHLPWFCSTLKVVKRPAGRNKSALCPWEMLAANASAVWLGHARLTPTPGTCADKRVGGKADPPNTEPPSPQGRPKYYPSVFFLEAINSPPTQRNESDLNPNKTSQSSLMRCASLASDSPTSLSSMGPAWCCVFWKWKCLCPTGCTEAEEIMDKKARCSRDVDLYDYYCSQGPAWESAQIFHFGR